MKNHLRGNLLLLVVTVGIACVIYPALMWLFANVLFPGKASGSLITEKANGKETIRGSALIGQPFTKDWYFKPRPSATSPAYNATASGGSNWGASNPKLRDRVARQLGPIVKYNQEGLKKNDSVQEDIEKWFVRNYQPDPKRDPLPVVWAKSYPTLAEAWMKSDDNKASVLDWLGRHPAILADWREAKLGSNPGATVPEPDLSDDSTIPFGDISVAFFESVAATSEFRNAWLQPADVPTAEKDSDGKPVTKKQFEPTTKGGDLQSTFFDLWLQAHPEPDLLQKVPADMVMASGSGLDPHITLRNAQYQLQRVVHERARLTNQPLADVGAKVQEIVDKHNFTPLSGLIGEPLVNVVEVNYELDQLFPVQSAGASN